MYLAKVDVGPRGPNTWRKNELALCRSPFNSLSSLYDLFISSFPPVLWYLTHKLTLLLTEAIFWLFAGWTREDQCNSCRGSFLVLDFASILMKWKAALENPTVMLEFIIKEETILRLLTGITIWQSFQMRDIP